MNWPAFRLSVEAHSKGWQKTFLLAIPVAMLLGVLMAYANGAANNSKFEIAAGTAIFLLLQLSATYIGVLAYHVVRELTGKKRFGVLAFGLTGSTIGIAGLLAVSWVSDGRWLWVGGGPRGSGHFEVNQ